MNKPLVALLVILALGVIATHVSAETRTLVSHPSMYELQQTCDQHGGQFRVGKEGGYACAVCNCDGKGGCCVVACTARRCSGETPKPMTRWHDSITKVLEDVMMQLSVTYRDLNSQPGPDTKLGVTEYLNGTAQ
jgi:hypothetical protein